MESERKSQNGLGGSLGRAPGMVKAKAERSCAVVTGVGGVPPVLQGNRMAAGASERVIEFDCASGARRERMRVALTRVVAAAVVAMGFCLGGAFTVQADNRAAPKGPVEG